MKVVILCGGLGSRLREETEFRPKPMLPIGGKPILWHIMKIYSHYGFRDFVLCLGYKGDAIKEYFYHHSLFSNDVTIRMGQQRSIQFHDSNVEDDWTVTLVDTGEATLKGGRLKKVAKYLDDGPFLATYGDGVANIDIRALVAYHREHGGIATLSGVRPPSLFGEIEIQGGRASLFVEKPQTSHGTINGGFFVFDRQILDYLDDTDDCDLERGALERIAAEGQLMVYPHAGQWACMDTNRDLEYLNELWKRHQAFWKVWA